MIYSTAERVQEPLRAAEDSSGVRRRGVLLAEGKRLVVPAAGATIGRSRDCDIVLEDHNVSRRHAQIRPRRGRTRGRSRTSGSTNGVRVNGRSVQRPERLNPGDELAIGTVGARFEVE
jgi:pSer/pThr/pTyr-binding forkhead associated (FHA) protein